MEKQEIKKNIDKLWKTGKDELDRLLKDTSRLVNKGESRIKKMSRKAENKMEVMALLLQREKLSYELGRAVSGIPKSKWEDNKKIDGLLAQINSLGRKIKKMGKK